MLYNIYLPFIILAQVCFTHNTYISDDQMSLTIANYGNRCEQTSTQVEYTVYAGGQVIGSYTTPILNPGDQVYFGGGLTFKWRTPISYTVTTGATE